eukprot:TRINITY_DN43274_c0_g1_i1.p1 TRINITY_DN43274_c0_g1~~TRINITY_DN43274_c0_g1_i1.p1  ORF type:complete len:919 (+),score=156.20 TRINITY_DN43274_c0_g1_i1:40-2796(+)
MALLSSAETPMVQRRITERLLSGKERTVAEMRPPTDSSIANFMAVEDPFGPPARQTSDSLASFGPPSRQASGPAEVKGSETGWLDLQSWSSACFAAIPLFLLSYSSCVSYAHLIVSGAWGYPVHAAAVTSMHLFSSGLTGLILPLCSKCPLIIPSADISVTIFYQKVVTDIVAAAAAEGILSAESVAATVMLALPLNTVLMSLVFYFVGEQKATLVVSYLPYPVVAGFLGSIGFAIFLGSFQVLADGLSPGCAGVVEMLQSRPWHLSAAVGMAVSSYLLRFVGLSARVLAIAPTMFFMVAFWLVVLGAALPVDQLREEMWLFQASSFEPFWSIWTAQKPSMVSWTLVPPRASTFLGLGLVLVLSLTLRIAGIESSTGAIMGIDDEVKRTGLASAVAGLCGTVIGSHSPGLTTFNMDAGSITFHTAILTAVLQLLLWLSGFPVMNIFPRFVLSGILMNLGAVMLQEWMWTARFKVGYAGLFVIYAQVAASATYGLLPSVLVGTAVALLSTQASFMKLHVLKYHVSGKSIRSNVQRSQRELQILQNHCEAIECLGLEGYLSEGPMVKLSNYVRQYVEHASGVRYMVFDLLACQGCNVSACALLAKMDKLLEHHGVQAFYSSLEADVMSTLKSFGMSTDRLFHTDCDTTTSFTLALEGCEDLVIKASKTSLSDPLDLKLAADAPEADLRLAIRKFLGLRDDQVDRLVEAGSWCQKNKGEKLTHQGTLETVMHIAVPGHSEVAEVIDLGACSGHGQEVEATRFGALCGLDCVLYDEAARSTCTVTAAGSWCLKLSSAAVQKLVKSDVAMYHCIASIGARQVLRQSDSLLQMLQLHQGGGWKGGHFDRRTAEVSAKMLSHPLADAQPSDVKKLSVLASPTTGRRMYQRKTGSVSSKFHRRTTLESWAEEWVKSRSDETLPAAL